MLVPVAFGTFSDTWKRGSRVELMSVSRELTHTVRLLDTDNRMVAIMTPYL